MKKLKKLLQTIIWGVFLVGVASVMAFVEKKHSQTVCGSFELKIMNPGSNALINEEKLISEILATTDTLAGKTLKEIKTYEIYRVLHANPYVKYSDIQTGIQGELKVSVELRQAIIRVIDTDGLSYYVDREGWIMPLNPGYPSRVPVFSGHVNDGLESLSVNRVHVDSLDKRVGRDIFAMAKYMHEDELLSRLIGQVYMNKQGDLELIPLVGEYTIHFGGFGKMEEKFEKLLAFYREGAGKAGWIDYRSIDLRYKNQVICSK